MATSICCNRGISVSDPGSVVPRGISATRDGVSLDLDKYFLRGASIRERKLSCHVTSQRPTPIVALSSADSSRTPSRGRPSSDDQKGAAGGQRAGKGPARKKIVAAQPKPDPFCYGCGASLQIEDVGMPGYLPPEVYAVKRQHRQLGSVLCERCKALGHGKMVAVVGGHGGNGSGGLDSGYVRAEDLRERLKHVSQRHALVVKLVDLSDFSGSFLTHVRDLVGRNPILLIGTKLDLLPRGTDPDAVQDWVQQAVARKRLNVVGIHLVSARTGEGMESASLAILSEKKGRDVYVMGAANVGKSAFIHALLRQMGERDLKAAAAAKKGPVTSSVPGTTLGEIPIDAFASGGGTLFDTPGVHLHHQVASLLFPDELALVAPRRRVTHRVARVRPIEVADRSRGDQPEITGSQGHDLTGVDGGVAGDGKERGWGGKVRSTAQSLPRSSLAPPTSLQGHSIFLGGLVRIDVLQAPPSVDFTYFGPERVPMYVVPTGDAASFYDAQVGRLLVPPLPRPQGLELANSSLRQFGDVLEFYPEVGQRPVKDLAISGMGWVTVSGVRNVKDTRGGAPVVVKVRVWVLGGIEVFVREPMPVGEEGAVWGQWLDRGVGGIGKAPALAAGSKPRWEEPPAW
eukprot:jgi/Mesvir1/9449/Mv17839-RA.1